MPSEQEKLSHIRAEIDAIDEQLQDLISRRARAAQEVARIKRASNPEIADFYRPEREAEVLRKVKARNDGPLAFRG